MENFIELLNFKVIALCRLFALLVISIGVGKAMIIYCKDVFSGMPSREAIEESRLEIGHSFSLALGFLVGGSILHTTFAPNWNDIGKLATIITIRTALTYFLLKDVKQSSVAKKEQKNDSPASPQS